MRGCFTEFCGIPGLNDLKSEQKSKNAEYIFRGKLAKVYLSRGRFMMWKKYFSSQGKLQNSNIFSARPSMTLEIFSMPIIFISNASQANPNKSISTHNPDISHGNDFRGGWRRNWKRKWFSKNIFSSLNELLINTFSCARQLSSYFLRHSFHPEWPSVNPLKAFFLTLYAKMPSSEQFNDYFQSTCHLMRLNVRRLGFSLCAAFW